MTLLKRIFSSDFSKYLLIFFALHLLLLNINTAEWGDSYRILRASEFIRQFNYPADEKRPPLFSTLLAVRPSGVDQVLWGRFEMVLISFACFVIFWLLLKCYVQNRRYQFIGILLWLFNPVFLYWSLRIMSDVPFAFFALLGVYLFDKWKYSLTRLRLFLLGLTAFLGVLTRFEGYLLFISLGFGVFLQDANFKKPLGVFNKLIKNIFSIRFLYVVSFLLFLIPYFFIRNPLNSTYFEEPGRRVYDFHMVYIYVVSLLFAFGVIPFIFIPLSNISNFFKRISENYAMAMFIVLELLLALAWPAAIPRLFTPIISFLIILGVTNLSYFEYYLDSHSYKKNSILLFACLGFYAISQFLLRQQFLVLNKNLFALILVSTSLAILLQRRRVVFYLLLLFSLVIWSLSTIWLHKGIFKAIQAAASYAGTNLTGNIGYNDISSVSSWYLTYKTDKHNINGFYYNTDKKANLEYDKLLSSNIDYLIITNEHNLSTTLDIKKRPYLEEIKEFRYNINGAEFFAKVIKFNK